MSQHLDDFPRQPPAGRPRVLLVEDNVVNQKLLTPLLEKAGYLVELAADGQEALLALEQRRFAVVIMDVHMPVMDGLRATRLIRARERAVGGRVPIIAVTAATLDGERERCLAAGMDEYFSKPIRAAELLPAVARLAGEGPPPGPEVAATSGDAPAASRPEWLAALQAMGFDGAGVARLARAFVDTVPPRLASLSEALRGGDFAAVRSGAHSIRGSLAVFGAHQAIEAAARLEGMVGPSGEANAVLAGLQERVETLTASMREHLEKFA